MSDCGTPYISCTKKESVESLFKRLIMVDEEGTLSLSICGCCTVFDFLTLTPQAEPPDPAEGMIYAGTDHHLYYYNGTTWLQLDNSPS